MKVLTLKVLSNKEVYGEGIDEEVLQLCNAINALPSLKTIGSCCGHGKTPFRIWRCKIIQGILLRRKTYCFQP